MAEDIDLEEILNNVYKNLTPEKQKEFENILGNMTDIIKDFMDGKTTIEKYLEEVKRIIKNKEE